MDLVRACLDKQLVDRNARPMGRVDGIVLEIVEGKQPQVSFIEVGAVVRWRRFHPWLGSLISRLNWKTKIVREDPYRIPWSKVVAAGIEVIAGVEAEKTPALAWELWIRQRIISRIPGA